MTLEKYVKYGYKSTSKYNEEEVIKMLKFNR